MTVEYENLFMNHKRQKLFQKCAQKNFKRRRKLRSKKIDKGIILPAEYDENDEFRLRIVGGIVDNKGCFVEESKSYSFGGNYDYDQKPKYIDEEVVFMGPFMKHWGHFIVDQISRLWYVAKNPSKYKIAYCGWNWKNDSGDLDGNFLELIKALGIKESQLINVQKPMQFKKIIIPDLSFVAKKYYSDEFVRLVDKIAKGVKVKIKDCPKKVYFTRTELPDNSRDFGEENVVGYLKSRGYTILAPEKLTFSEQVFYLNNAEEFCTTVGSTSHNIMFVRSNNRVIILNKFQSINGYQVVIDHLTNARVTYVDAYTFGFPVGFGMGPFLLNVNKYLGRCMGGNWKKYRVSMKTIKEYLDKYKEIYKEPNNKRRMQNDKTGISRKIIEQN